MTNQPDREWKETDTVGVSISQGSIRRAGRNISAWKYFFEHGKKGEAIIFATPEGDFYSPESHKRALAEQEKMLMEKVKAIVEEHGRKNAHIITPAPNTCAKIISSLTKEIK